MKITCSSCNTRYSIPDEKIQGEGRTFKIRCKSCGEMILVQGVAEASAASGGGGGGAPADDQAVWYYAVGSDRHGPVGLAEISGLLGSGQVTADTYVWKNGMADWTHLSEVPELALLMSSGGGGPPATFSAAPAASSGTGEQPQVAGGDEAASFGYADAGPFGAPAAADAGPFGQAAPDPASPFAAPAADEASPFAQSARPAGGDFGGGAPGPADSPFGGGAQAAPGAAPAGSGDDPFAFVSASAQPAKSQSQDGVHGRRESSVLFSLDDLGETQKGMSREEALVTETSGLIDIRAVAARSNTGESSPFGETEGMAGLVTPGAPSGGGGGLSMSVPVRTRKRRSSGPWLLVAVVFLVFAAIAGAAVWFLTREKEPVQREVIREIVRVEPEKKDAGPTDAAPAAPAKNDVATASAADATAEADTGPEAEEGAEKTASATKKKHRRRGSSRKRSKSSSDDDGAIVVSKPKDDDGEKKHKAKDATELLLGLQGAKTKKESSGGALSTAAIKSKLTMAAGKLSACYKLQGGGRPAQMTVKASLTIKNTGQVSRASVSGSDLKPAVKSCIQRTLMQVKFDSFDGRTMKTRQSITLRG